MAFFTASPEADAAASITEPIPFAQEGTFWRSQPRSPIVDVPCQTPIPPERCGQISSGPITAPQMVDGNMIVGSNGPAGADKSDTFWIATQPDVVGLGLVDSVEKLTVVFTKSPDQRGDFGTPVLKACNIVAAFGVSEGTNPWDDRPAIDCSSAKTPKVEGLTYTFDVTDFANTWLDNQGFGMAIVPGLPGTSSVVNDVARTQAESQPFQITFMNSLKADAERKPLPGRATAVITYTAEEEFEEDFGGADDLGLGDLAVEDFGVDVGGLDDNADLNGGQALDDSPPSVGSTRRTLIAASRPGMYWGILLLVPLGLALSYILGSALGPLGDPLPLRQGGVARLFGHRR